MSRVDAPPDSLSGLSPLLTTSRDTPQPVRSSAPAAPAPDSLIAPAARAELELARELVVAPHAPLRFVAAQLLWALAPLAGLLGVDEVAHWAARLEAPAAEPPAQK